MRAITCCLSVVMAGLSRPSRFKPHDIAHLSETTDKPGRDDPKIAKHAAVTPVSARS
jgi:hypothetical protein